MGPGRESIPRGGSLVWKNLNVRTRGDRVTRRFVATAGVGPSIADLAVDLPHPAGDAARQLEVEQISVASIRPEVGLGRQRDREGHRALQRSIEQFGVLTPITVRPARDGTNDFLLIKGQGRTLACRQLGIHTIPAMVVGDAYAEDEKVQQFLVENVARLKMRPVDRALLISRARQAGEETASVAARFGVTAATVRRLEAQLGGASHGEVVALRSGQLTLAVHALVASQVGMGDRSDVVGVLAAYPVTSKDLEALLGALGWRQLEDLGTGYRHRRLALLAWACAQLAELPRGSSRERLRRLALRLPEQLHVSYDTSFAGAI
jgi:ParB/RepB/Spo0J family partition protein